MRSAHSRALSKELALGSNRPDTLYNRNDWVQVYQMLTPGKENKFRIQYGSGTITQSENSYRISVAMTALNKSSPQPERRGMRFYLNEQMAEFSKPITVIVNGKVRFEE